MKQIFTFLLSILIASSIATAQPQHDKNYERIKALKIAYITEQLDLKPEQAEKFWPVYNQFESEKRQLRNVFFEKFKGENPTADRKTAHEYLKAETAYQEQELALKKKYKDELLNTITAEQLVQLYKADRGFRQILIRELRERHGLKVRKQSDR